MYEGNLTLELTDRSTKLTEPGVPGLRKRHWKASSNLQSQDELEHGAPLLWTLPYKPGTQLP